MASTLTLPPTPLMNTPSTGVKAVKRCLCLDMVAEAQTSAPTGIVSVSNLAGPGSVSLLAKEKTLVWQCGRGWQCSQGGC